MMTSTTTVVDEKKSQARSTSQASRRRARKQAHAKAEEKKMVVLFEGKGVAIKPAKTVKTDKPAVCAEIKDIESKVSVESKETKDVKSSVSSSTSSTPSTKEGVKGAQPPRWHEITNTYGEWVDEFSRLRYIFDGSGRYEKVYNEYGYNSIVPELDHREIRYHDRINLYQAKKCFARREEYLNALAALSEVKEIQSMVYDAAVSVWSPNGADDVGGLAYARSIANSLLQEVNAFLLYSMNVNRDAPKTGGFSFFHPKTGATLYAWRSGSKQVSMEMTIADTRADDGEQKTITDRKEIFKFIGDDTKLVHELFYDRTRKEVFSTLVGFMREGWVVIPASCW